MGKIRDSLQHAWNAFQSNERGGDLETDFQYGGFASVQPTQTRLRMTSESTVITPIKTRLALDVAGVDFRHVRIDNEGFFTEAVKSKLSNCLGVEANIDQSATAFKVDLAYTLLDHGVAAIVPIDTTIDPGNTDSYDILSMRVGHVTQWYPKHVRVNVYNEATGMREEILVEKRYAAIVENPLYAVMNEPNSTLKRLMRKLSLQDAMDEQNGSGKLNMIIQLPYVIKSEARQKQAAKRRDDIELQLRESPYGIAYTDGTEKITQLNRAIENDLPAQIDSLTNLLYSQLGLTKEILDGTADEQVLLNYQNRTLKPILRSISEAMTRTFLSKTARTQGQQVTFIRNPFELVPINNIAEIADKFTRNEILTSNEIRSIIGFRPSEDPKANKLQNSNMPQPLEDPMLPPAPDTSGLPAEDV